jgi:transposase-like protein
MVATGVNADGYREILGVASSTAESGAGWNSFFKDLVARGLSGVALVTSDAHAGLVEAIGANLPGASWQRSSVNISSGGKVPLVHLHHWERTLAA